MMNSLKLNLVDYAVGVTIGTGENIEKLKKGSFAKVKFAKNNKTNKICAIKIMNKEKLIKFKQIDHISNEIKIQSALKHPNSVQLFGYFKDSSNLYLVMEMIHGGDLFTFLQSNNRLTEETTK